MAREWFTKRYQEEERADAAVNTQIREDLDNMDREGWTLHSLLPFSGNNICSAFTRATWYREKP